LAINIPGNDLSSGDTVFQFIGSGPPKDTGLHRYVFLLFKQTDGRVVFDSPYVSDHSSLNRPSTSTKDLIKSHNLQLVAGNFYQAEYDEYVPTLHAQLAGKKI
jgi:phosphatidylethanolamine-binding protein